MAALVPKITWGQRDYITALLVQQELPTQQVTVLHRDLFKKAGIDWVDCSDLKATVSSLTKAAAHRLIDAIRERESTCNS